MNNRKGFTLVELIAVLVVLALIIGLSATAYLGIRESSLDQDYNNLVAYLETKAANYARRTGITSVTVQDLIDAGETIPDDEINIYNPKNNESMNCFLIVSSYENGEYNAKLQRDIGKEEDGSCRSHEAVKDHAICIIQPDGTCLEIEKPMAIDKWFADNLTLGVLDKNKNLLTEATAVFSWVSTGGDSSNASTITTNVSLANSSNYTVTVNSDGNEGKASAIINIDKQAPAIASVESDPSWNTKKKIKIYTTDFNGSGVDKISVNNNPTCPTNRSEYKIGVSNNTTTVEVVKGDYYICAIDKVGNMSATAYHTIVDNIDTIGAETISLTVNPTGYAKTVSLIGKAKDTQSGLVAYQFNESATMPSTGWVTITKTNNEITQTKPNVSKNGTYYFWVKDAVGNVSSASYKVNNIDSEGAETISLTANPTGYAKTVSLIGKAKDTKSGLVAYQFNESATAPTTGWVTITKTNNEITQTKTNVSKNSTYYFWVKDAVGNVSNAKYKLDKIDNKAADTISLTSSVPNTTYTKSLVLTGTATDNKSGITQYQITTSSSTPSSGWKTVSATKTISTQLKVTSNATYYLWVKDAVGNIDKVNYKVTNIDTVGPLYKSGGILSISGTTGSVTTATFTDVSTPITVYYYFTTSTATPSTTTLNSTKKTFTARCGTKYYAWAKAVDKLGNYTMKYLGSKDAPACCSVGNYRYYTCSDRGWKIEGRDNECTGEFETRITSEPCNYYGDCGDYGGCTTSNLKWRYCEHYYGNELDWKGESQPCTYIPPSTGGSSSSGSSSSKPNVNKCKYYEPFEDENATLGGSCTSQGGTKGKCYGKNLTNCICCSGSLRLSTSNDLIGYGWCIDGSDKNCTG